MIPSFLKMHSFDLQHHHVNEGIYLDFWYSNINTFNMHVLAKKKSYDLSAFERRCKRLLELEISKSTYH